MVHQRRPWTATMHRTPCSVHTRSWLSASQYKQPLTTIPRGNHKNRTTRTQTQRCEKRPCSRTNKSRNRSRKQLTEKHLLPPTRSEPFSLCIRCHCHHSRRTKHKPFSATKGLEPMAHPVWTCTLPRRPVCSPLWCIVE